ncbi:FMN-dependent NADH-azoreductase [Francisella frigiditurris]|uniref:FMN dependent NADH:quinone oxidoreductase n=1 Tax=Francisella frigiditurris TaxID=1542390 RepID=A0A1J0KTD4_9GAMM|nr:NADPH-dependent FMN reductase family protein [Francisella frigiditurris]
MKKVLHIRTSSNLQKSFSRNVGDNLISHFKNTIPETQVIERDLVKDTINHLNPNFLNALFTNDEAGLALSNKLINELFSADVIVIESPMYNFSIPSMLKAWIDHILVARKTFRYTENGPEGLVKDKKAILILSKGGVYREEPAKSLDYQEGYLQTILNFIGITDIEIIRIEGVAKKDIAEEILLNQAKEKAKSIKL